MRLAGRQRLWFLLSSSLWLLAWYLLYAVDPPPFEWVGFFMFGVTLLVFISGIASVVGGFRR